MSRENIDLIVILNEARKCIMQNTNMNEHCTYTIKQIEKGHELVKKLTLTDVRDTLILTPKDAEVFFNEIMNPKDANEALKKAMLKFITR